MAIRRVCDRCGVDVAKPVDLDSTIRTVTIPAAASASATVTKDLSVTVALTVDKDLCAVCLGALLKTYIASQPIRRVP